MLYYILQEHATYINIIMWKFTLNCSHVYMQNVHSTPGGVWLHERKSNGKNANSVNYKWSE